LALKNTHIFFWLQPEAKTILTKLLTKFPPEIDASQLQKILRAHWKSYLSEKPSLELCKSLIMLRDFNISGRINLMDIPVLMHMLQFWRVWWPPVVTLHNDTRVSRWHSKNSSGATATAKPPATTCEPSCGRPGVLLATKCWNA
jgi:hypothetical protein